MAEIALQIRKYSSKLNQEVETNDNNTLIAIIAL